MKIAIIGLDGATFDVITPLVESGKLPNIGRLLDEGAYSPLESILPPVTGPAWSVLATGKNPGQLGVFDFLNRRSISDYSLFPISSGDLAGQSYWDILGNSGQSVGILNYPMLVPAYPINGWLVSGFGASKLQDFTFPAKLRKELDTITGGYEISVYYGLPKYHQNFSQLIQDILSIIEKRIVSLEYLVRSYPVDVCTVVFSMSDVASHTLWRFWSNYPSDVESDRLVSKLRSDFIHIWETLDGAIGRVIDLLSSDGHVFIVSDHGFGPSRGVFNINQWLLKTGYLVRKRNSTLAGNKLREWLVQKVTPFLEPHLRKLQGTKAQRLLRASILREIDLQESKAFVLENGDLCGGIYINRHYPKFHGLDENQFIENTCQEIRQDFLRYSQKEGLDLQVFRSSELYTGEKTVLSPEILVVVDNLKCSISPRLRGQIYEDRPHHPMKSGNHRLDGIFIAAGPKIRIGKFMGARLQDIAPTILSTAGLAIPESMDGRVLSEIFLQEFRSRTDTEIPITGEPTGAVQIQTEFDEDEKNAFLRRLADLGYLE